MLKGTHPHQSCRYWRCSLRVSALIVQHLRGVALREGWQISDLARVLICLGASSSFLRLENPKVAERFKTLATLGTLADALDANLGRVSRRPHAPPGLSASDLLGLRLPQGLCRIITTYAATSGRSRNEVLVMFLERGLVIYLKGQNTLLETFRSLKSERTKMEGTEERKGDAHTSSSGKSQEVLAADRS